VLGLAEGEHAEKEVVKKLRATLVEVLGEPPDEAAG